ncbi:alpha/beta hydrolase, partial [Mesorhizobium sp. M1A.F.Ca.IN.022.04.1.1]
MASDSFSDFFYAAPDGLKLHARIYGEANGGWPVVCLPGLTRNARDFHELALYLSGKAKTPRKVVAFDYRGRGRSDYDPDISHYNVGVEAGDVLAGLSALGIEEAGFIGTSRGGLIIHVLGA